MKTSYIVAVLIDGNRFILDEAETHKEAKHLLKCYKEFYKEGTYYIQEVEDDETI